MSSAVEAAAASRDHDRVTAPASGNSKEAAELAFFTGEEAAAIEAAAASREHDRVSDCTSGNSINSTQDRRCLDGEAAVEAAVETAVEAAVSTENACGSILWVYQDRKLIPFSVVTL